MTKQQAIDLEKECDKIFSDAIGWECEGTQVEDVFYDSTNNLLILTQEGDNHVGTFNYSCYVHTKDTDIRYVNPKRLE